MIVSIGIDLIEISRIENALTRRTQRFRDRVFTKPEIAYCESRASKVASYAARFAAKEAAMKALRMGWFDGVAWRDIEVASGAGGAPSINLYRAALERFKSLGATASHLSLSHSRDLAIAEIVFESRWLR
ncbi:MAG TPA: holo-ACP synthase [Blastocatellia bacterium]